MTDVAVLGGGVGGLSLVQELAKRGCSGIVFGPNECFGATVRSFPGPTADDTAGDTAGRTVLEPLRWR